jgi:predicted ATPase
MSDEAQPESLCERGYVGCQLTPIGGSQVFLRFRPGVNVLFGRNGVGKSRVLRALSSLLDASGSGDVLYYSGYLSHRAVMNVLRTAADPSGEKSNEALVELESSWTHDDVTADFWFDHFGQASFLAQLWLTGPRVVQSLVDEGLQSRGEAPLSSEVAEAIAAQNIYALTRSAQSVEVAVAFVAADASGPLADELNDFRASIDVQQAKQDAGAGMGSDDVWFWNQFEAPDLIGIAHPGIAVEEWASSAGDKPNWVPLSLETIGTAAMGPTGEVWDLDDNSDHLDVHFDIEFSMRLSDGGEEGRKGKVAFESHVPRVFGPDTERAEAVALSDMASELLARLLEEAPTLTIDLGAADEWFRGYPPRWKAIDRSSGHTVLLAALSDTQLRWAQLAIRLTNLSQPMDATMQLGLHGLSVTIVCDEPERGLPVSGQKRLSRALNSISEEFGVDFFIATHSAAILEDPRVHLNRVDRDPDGQIHILELGDDDRNRLDRVGIPPGEMPHLFRMILLVEGSHDEWVLDELIGDELADLRVKVLPVHGAKKMPRFMNADADFLFTHTDASFSFVVDNARTEPLRKALSNAQEAATPEDALAAIDAVFEGSTSEEESIIRSLLTRAVEQSRLARIGHVFGFEASDIIEYLPCEALVGEQSWAELRQSHADARAMKKGPKDFKKWLEDEHDASFTEHSIRAATASMDHIPVEFTDLLERCQEASAN